MDSRKHHKGSCHCGAVTFTVKLTDELNTARRCTCSICARRGAVAVSAELADIEFKTGEDKLSLYQFGTGAAKHYFCKICGIYTHHQRRSNPSQFGINLACLEGQTPFLDSVAVLDGKNHPRDQKDGAGADGAYKGLEVGHLIFTGDKGRL
jgi:hypothetical protein